MLKGAAATARTLIREERAMSSKAGVFLARVALALGLLAPLLVRAEEASFDKETLLRAKIGTQPDKIVAFLRQQVVPDKERQHIEALILQLGGARLDVRETACDRLIAVGAPAVPFLRQASRSSHMEVARRADVCLADIKGAVDPLVLGAGVRLLVRQAPPEALATLLEVFPFAGDETVEDELLTGIGVLSLPGDRPDPLLQSALQDPMPARRGAAAFVIARRGNGDQRDTVRRLLGDPSERVRSLAVRGLLGERAVRLDVPLSAEDKLIVTSAGILPTTASLLEFFRKRTLDDDARKHLERLVQQLDSNVFTTRQEAARKLVDQGTPALAFLRPALVGGSLEMTRRVENCVKEIEKGPGPALPIAAARLLTRRAPPEGLPVLLDFAPFGDDASVEEEVLNCLATLAVQQPRVPDALAVALTDELPARRALAAVVLGLVGTRDHAQALRPLLADTDARVRLRSAQGMLALKYKEAVPVLLALLEAEPAAVAVQAEELLRQLAGETAPTQSVADSGDARKKAQEAWATWWRDQGDRIDLARPLAGRAYLGLTLVAELSSGRRLGNHRLWEFDASDRVRWETSEPVNPIDARILPNNRILVAEYGANRVTERDRSTWQVIWEKKTTNLVVSCQRLASGNTFIATYNSGIMEVTPEGREVYNFNPAPNGNGIVNALKLRSGTIACITAQGQLLEVDSTGRQLRSTMLENAGGWNGLEELPDGRLLVALQLTGKVVELDSQRKQVWECPAPGAVHAVRLPNGHTLVAGGNTQKLFEVDRGGKIVWEKSTTGRPFHIRRR
jgi:hypothetical protein